MWFAVLTHYAFTLLCALNSCTEAITIILSTLWFLTSTPPLGYKRWNSFKSARMSKVGKLLCLIDMQLAAIFVRAIIALTFLVAKPPFRKTLAVHLETIDLCALAALVLMLARGEVHVWNGAQDMLFIQIFWIFLDELVKEVLAVAHLICILLKFRFADELEWARRGRRVLGLDF